MQPSRRPRPPSSGGGGHPKAKFVVPRRNEVTEDGTRDPTTSLRSGLLCSSSIGTKKLATASPSPLSSLAQNESPVRGSNSEAKTHDAAPPTPLSPLAQNGSPLRGSNIGAKTHNAAPPTPLSPLVQNGSPLRGSSSGSNKNDTAQPTPLSALAQDGSPLSSRKVEPPRVDIVIATRFRDSALPSARLLAFGNTPDGTERATAAEEDNRPPSPEEQDEASVSFATAAKNPKCSVAFLGGAGAALGASRALGARKACARLRCAACDFTVVRIAGQRWKGDLSYLFLRNAMPCLEKLAAMLEPDATVASYACQCSWKSVPKTEKLVFNGTPSDCGKLLQWCCAGHPS